jgi:hypothetical protein
MLKFLFYSVCSLPIFLFSQVELTNPNSELELKSNGNEKLITSEEDCSNYIEVTQEYIKKNPTKTSLKRKKENRSKKNDILIQNEGKLN